MTIQENKLSENTIIRIYERLLEEDRIKMGGAAYKRMETLIERRNKNFILPSLGVSR